jgi:hypothetical protein
MNRYLVLVLLLLSFCPPSSAQTKYSTYTNDRFSFSIDYPTNLLNPSKIEDATNSGEIFYSKNKDVEMRAWGEYNALYKTWREWYKTQLNYFGTKPTYTVFKGNWFVISGLKNGKIFYQKTLRRKLKEIDVFYTFTIEYPQTERAKFDPAVQHIARSFKFDPTVDV